MLTFTHTVDALPLCPDLHWYSLVGNYLDSEGSTVFVAESSGNLPRMLKTLEYYLTDIEGIEVVYKTIVTKG